MSDVISVTEICCFTLVTSVSSCVKHWELLTLTAQPTTKYIKYYLNRSIDSPDLLFYKISNDINVFVDLHTCCSGFHCSIDSRDLLFYEYHNDIACFVGCGAITFSHLDLQISQRYSVFRLHLTKYFIVWR